jgi:hypothetical protein
MSEQCIHLFVVYGNYCIARTVVWSKFGLIQHILLDQLPVLLSQSLSHVCWFVGWLVGCVCDSVGMTDRQSQFIYSSDRFA